MSVSVPLPSRADIRPAVIGLGYVGLPLAVEFGKQRATVGFDINADRVAALAGGHDATEEVDAANLKAADQLTFTSSITDLAACNVYIVAVPTPIDSSHRPDLKPLIAASELVGQVIKKGDIVIYESTVYPGATEEDCIPVVEQVSNLIYNRDFYAGYSPERINPGDKERPLTKIMKVTSGSTAEVAELVDALYGTIIEAGTFKATSIKVAEASKIIENTQRDVNIALINELSIIFSHLDVDTSDVLDAAATKWNFSRFTPGLVGGHCIGVDPYYLVHKSMAVGHIPDIIRKSREINDGMARNVVNRLMRAMIERDLSIKDSRVLVLGFTFKENCPDVRNTKVTDLIANLESLGMQVDICDTWADPEEVQKEYARRILSEAPGNGAAYDVVVLAVPHDDFVRSGVEPLRGLLTEGGILFDMKSVFDRKESDLRL